MIPLISSLLPFNFLKSPLYIILVTTDPPWSSLKSCIPFPLERKNLTTSSPRRLWPTFTFTSFVPYSSKRAVSCCCCFFSNNKYGDRHTWTSYWASRGAITWLNDGLLASLTIESLGLVVKYRSAEFEGVRFDSAQGIQNFSLSHALDKTKKISISSPSSKLLTSFLQTWRYRDCWS